MQAILLPETWLVQPKIVSMHAIGDPERARRPSVQSERLAKTIRPGNVLRHVDSRRLKAVSFNPPDEVSLRIMRWILTAGDSRYWSWTATKRDSDGLVRNSLAYELCTAKSHIKASLKRLLDDELMIVKETQDGREKVEFTLRGKVLLAEASWRHQLRDWMPGERDRFEAFGYQEVSIVVDRALLINKLEHDIKKDVIWAATEGYAEGERYA
jgi:predicted transcriptional regulator